MSMQMDAYFKTGQIGTLFVHVELLHGGSSGGWVGQGGLAQKSYVPVQIIFSGAFWFTIEFVCYFCAMYCRPAPCIVGLHGYIPFVLCFHCIQR